MKVATSKLKRILSSQLTFDMVTYGANCAIADLLAQFIEAFKFDSLLDRPITIDWTRLSRYLIFGTFISAPFLSLTYSAMDRAIPIPHGTLWSHQPGWAQAVLQHVFWDQVGFGVIWQALYFVSMGLMQGNQLDEVVAHADRQIVPVMLDGLSSFAALQYLNFALVPTKYRVPAVAVTDMAWTTYLSMSANASGKACVDHSKTAKRKEG